MKTIFDLKLAAFLKLHSPESFQGTERDQSGRVAFLFTDEVEVKNLIFDYLKGTKFTFSPQEYGQQLDTCKNLIFQDYKV